VILQAFKNEQEENRKKQLEANPELATASAAPARKPLHLSQRRSAPSSPVGTPTKSTSNDITAKQDVAPASAAE